MLVKDKARLDAAQVLRETWALGTPVDPERIASQLDMIVTRLPLDRGVSGMLKAEPGLVEIFVNSVDPEPRQRFTIAHEIGHWYERTSRGLDDFNVIDYRSNDNYNLREFYADEFAASLLMPTNALRELLDAETPMPLIAAHFGVSVPAAKMRVERLDA